MKDNINTYIVRLIKIEDLIHIDILNKSKFNVGYYHAEFHQDLNKYYLYLPYTGFIAKVLLHNNLIEPIDPKNPSKFILTQTALISLL